MIGDAYFQLRAQIGTALFSLTRLAGDVDAPETTQAPLRTAQAALREPFQLITLGQAGSGKSTLLNTLFGREFCGAAAPTAAGKITVFKPGAEANDVLLNAETVECQRPHSFLRDFTLIDTPGFDLPDSKLAESLAPFLPGADLILCVVAVAAVGGTDAWTFLRRLGREALKHTVFIVWQASRGSVDEGTNAMKRLRQAMLKNLGQACPIFVASAQDRAALEKLERWIENEIIFSGPHRAGFQEIGAIAQATLREVAGKPRAAAQVLRREAEQVRRLSAVLAQHEEQSHRQVAGTLWTLTQGFDVLRRRGEMLLRQQPVFTDFFRKGGTWQRDFARDFESEARESLATQVNGVLKVLETDLREGAAEYFRALPPTLREDASVSVPKFPRAEITQTVIWQEAPIETERVLAEACVRAGQFLRLPVLAAVGAAAVTLGVLPTGFWVGGSAALAVGATAFVLVLALLLRRNVIAVFGQHFAANRATLLAVLEPPLREAIDQFYADLAPPLTARGEALAVQLQDYEPLLARIQQLEATFTKITTDLQAGVPSVEPAGDET